MYRMKGKIDSNNAAEFEKELMLAKPAEIDASQLEYISSAGLRVLLKLTKAVGDVTVNNVSNEVYEIFDVTGFTEILNVKKAMREISVEGCEKIGEGASGKVYRIAKDMIAKVYNPGVDLDRIESERKNAKTAFVNGIPTAITFDNVRNGEEYCMEDNPLPIAVTDGSRAVTLGSSESNYHLIAIAYEDNSLYLDISHFLTDGQGSFPFLQTFLYCYLHSLHPEEAFDTKRIIMPDSKIKPAEMEDDPYPDTPIPAEPLVNSDRPEEIFSMPDQIHGYEGMDKWTSIQLIIRQKDIMSYISSLDGSPSSFFLHSHIVLLMIFIRTIIFLWYAVCSIRFANH